MSPRRRPGWLNASSGDPDLWANWLANDPSRMWQLSTLSTPVTASSQPVGAVVEKSGNGRNLLQDTSGQRPTYSDTGCINDGPGLLLDGASNTLFSPLLDLPEATIFVAARVIELKLYFGLVKYATTENSSGAGDGVIGYYAGVLVLGDSSTTVWYQSGSAPPYVDGTDALLVIRWDASGANARINEADYPFGGVAGTYAPPMGAKRIFAAMGYSGTYSKIGLSALRVYTKYLDDTKTAEVEAEIHTELGWP